MQLVNSPGWIEFIGDRNIKTDDQAKEYLEKGPMKSYVVNGFGLCMVETRAGGAPIGMCGIIKRDYLENPDIGFAFLPEFFGKGFAFEIAKATLEHAKQKLKLPVIFAITVPHNKSSIKLLEKIGMKFIKPVFLPNDPAELMLFSTAG